MQDIGKLLALMRFEITTKRYGHYAVQAELPKILKIPILILDCARADTGGEKQAKIKMGIFENGRRGEIARKSLKFL